MDIREYDSIVIGAGAAGMTAAATIAEAGFRVAILDREDHLGGILMQCIHNGFGLHRFGEELTGPEYAERTMERLLAQRVDTFLESTVVDFRADGEKKVVHAYSARHGVLELCAPTVVLAMGCRERNRGNIGIPGTRPSGVFTAGLAQRLLNIDGYLPGKRVVIVGSGDIGLIMARRMSWVGATVLAVVEILPYPSGLTRNIVQCLDDFDIPLYLSHSVTRIKGTHRVEGVDIAPLENGVPVAEKGFSLDCDAVLLSVGLIPENELSRGAGVAISPNTNGPQVDHALQTTCPGVFACGNVLHVHDLVDYASEEAERCGHSVAAFLAGATDPSTEQTVPIVAGANLKYVIPGRCARGQETRFMMRSLKVADRATLVLRQGKQEVKKKVLRHVRPAEMIAMNLKKAESEHIVSGQPLEISLE